jgi:hypothetical protein
MHVHPGLRNLQVLPRFRQKILLRGLYLYGLFNVAGAVDWMRFQRDCKMTFFSPALIRAFGNAVLTMCCQYDAQLRPYCQLAHNMPLKWIPKNVLVTIARHLSLLFRLRRVKISSGVQFPKWSNAPEWWSDEYDLSLVQTVRDWGFSSSARILEKLRSLDQTLSLLQMQIFDDVKREDLFMKICPVPCARYQFLWSLNAQEERIRALIADAVEYAERPAVTEIPKLNASALLPVDRVTFGQSPITLHLAVFRAAKAQNFFMLTWVEHPECQIVGYNLDIVYRRLVSSVMESGKLALGNESLIPTLPALLRFVERSGPLSDFSVHA